MIELTDEQVHALESRDATPPRLVNPRTQEAFVLLRIDEYERLRDDAYDDSPWTRDELQAVAEQSQSLRGLYPHVMEVFGREGWDDPAMDVYDELDPRGKP